MPKRFAINAIIASTLFGVFTLGGLYWKKDEIIDFIDERATKVVGKMIEGGGLDARVEQVLEKRVADGTYDDRIAQLAEEKIDDQISAGKYDSHIQRLAEAKINEQISSGRFDAYFAARVDQGVLAFAHKDHERKKLIHKQIDGAAVHLKTVAYLFADPEATFWDDPDHRKYHNNERPNTPLYHTPVINFLKLYALRSNNADYYKEMLKAFSKSGQEAVGYGGGTVVGDELVTALHVTKGAKKLQIQFEKSPVFPQRMIVDIPVKAKIAAILIDDKENEEASQYALTVKHEDKTIDTSILTIPGELCDDEGKNYCNEGLPIKLKEDISVLDPIVYSASPNGVGVKRVTTISRAPEDFIGDYSAYEHFKKDIPVVEHSFAYTSPELPGSSGSGIYSTDGEYMGVLTSVVPRLQLTFFSPLDRIVGYIKPRNIANYEEVADKIKIPTPEIPKEL